MTGTNEHKAEENRNGGRGRKLHKDTVEWGREVRDHKEGAREES